MVEREIDTLNVVVLSHNYELNPALYIAAPSRRGDLEILGYCLLQWLCGKLPWEDKLLNKEYVRDQKVKYA